MYHPTFLQYIIVPISLHPHQHVSLSFLLYLVSVKWYFIVSLICISPILWSPEAKNLLIGKDPDAGRDWRQKEKGATEDEMAGWHHRLSGHEFKQTLGDGERQGGWACCSARGCKESDTTQWLNNSSVLREQPWDAALTWMVSSVFTFSPFTR